MGWGSIAKEHSPRQGVGWSGVRVEAKLKLIVAFRPVESLYNTAVLCMLSWAWARAGWEWRWGCGWGWCASFSLVFFSCLSSSHYLTWSSLSLPCPTCLCALYIDLDFVSCLARRWMLACLPAHDGGNRAHKLLRKFLDQTRGRVRHHAWRKQSRAKLSHRWVP